LREMDQGGLVRTALQAGHVRERIKQTLCHARLVGAGNRSIHGGTVSSL
jgi:hypothetical protein